MSPSTPQLRRGARGRDGAEDLAAVGFGGVWGRIFTAISAAYDGDLRFTIELMLDPQSEFQLN